MSKRTICFITGTRAEYGLLKPVMEKVSKDNELHLQIIATAMHLSPEFGMTYQEIEADGFTIDEKNEMLLSSDTSVGISKSIGLGVISFAESFQRLKPDLIVVLGDRFEILAAAQAALIARIPLAHIAGGDITEGAWDESIRHAITKMSHIHFVTNQGSFNRVKQLGENPQHIFNVGSTGIDNILHQKFLAKEYLQEELGFLFRKKNILVTFHPSTLDFIPASKQFAQLLSALHHLGEDVGIIITKPNADLEGRSLFPLIEAFVKEHQNAKAFESLGQERYLSVMNTVDMVVGNSSSGLYEAPSFKIPTINIGSRQKGRLQANSVINCEPDEQSVVHAMERGFALDCSETLNPYGTGHASESIVSVLKSFDNYKSLLTKPFFNL
ncbi:UDP-N-acetylglucosamine 2-epimerase [Legionella sp. W05-934-2]|uniref:UDP-N-acetylglucosamine 2-epimerase n=1 Tax=Legionella sp. W05-934-2 TaxID=1198649 RepID=UPI00346381D7